MAFRIEKRIAGFLICGAMLVAGQPLSVQVRHRHLHGGSEGTLSIDAGSVSFVESRSGKDSREWRFEDIQQLSLSSTELRILTYEDRKWQLGRDRDYVFDRLPEGFAEQARPRLAGKLGRRFVAALADSDWRVLWQVGAKLRHGLGGAEGVLKVGEDRVEFESKAEGESRAWRFVDIDTVSSAGPFDLSITTMERSGWRHAGPTEFRFQLKDEMKEASYNELWRRVSGGGAEFAATR
jgi:hypothetical protein